MNDINVFAPEMPSGEFSARLRSAQIADWAFFVRQITDADLSEDDIQYLAQALHGAASSSGKALRADIKQRLMSLGRSPRKAEQLAAAIFR